MSSCILELSMMLILLNFNLLSAYYQLGWILADFSVDKYCVLNIGNIVIEPLLNICGKSLSALSSNRDLGFIISHDLSPSTHISVKVAKAHQRANAVLRAFVSRDRSLLLRVYLVYVRPLVENNFVIWSPCLKQNIEAVERVQRHFTKVSANSVMQNVWINWICLALS